MPKEVLIKLKRRLFRIAFALLLIVIPPFLHIQLPTVLAHGGEDHGEKNAPVVSVGQMNAKITTTDTLEILIKYPTPKPAEETTVRVFLTDTKTNAPVSGVKVMLSLEAQEKAQTSSNPISFGIVYADTGGTEVEAKPTDSKGVYEAHLVFPNYGQYKLAIRLSGANLNQKAAITGIEVPAKSVNEAAAGTSWVVPTILIALLIVFISIAVLIHLFGLRRYSEQSIESVKETITPAYSTAQEREA